MHPPPSQKSVPKEASLVVFIPALDEAPTIEEVIRNIPQDLPGIGKLSVVVVDDGSTDETSELARQAGAIVVSHRRNIGVGRAYSTGIDRALSLGADIIVNIDADGQFNPADIALLVEPIVSGEAEFVTASRFKDKAKTPKMSRWRLYGNKAVSRIVSFMVGRRFYDVSCGFRAITREAALRLNITNAFTYTQETFLDLAAKGIQVCEVPVQIRGTREHGESRVAANLWHYGHRVLRIMLRAYRDYWPWKFFAWLAAFCFALGFAFGGWLLYWRFTHGAFSPHIWAGFVGGFFVLMGMLCTLMGMMADMLRRIRMNAEHSLYFDKKRHYGQMQERGS